VNAGEGSPVPGRASAPRVLAVASHPIQYQAPWFRELARAPDLDFSVLFVQQPDARQQGRGFGVAFEWDVPIMDGYRWQRVPAIRGRGGLKGFWAARIVQPRALLRELDPDVVLVTGWHTWGLVQLLLAASGLGIPVVMRGESNSMRRRPWPTRMLHRMLLRRCAAFLPIGKASHQFYRSYGLPERLLFDTPYFVDNQRFVQAAGECLPRRPALRERWRIPPAAFCFCYAGKLEPKKRILDLLAALRIAAGKSSIALHLLVVGTGELMERAKAQAALHDLPVTFAGFLNQSEIASAYVAADCLVLPSDFGETWGLGVNEAMACGLPAIVSDHVGCGPDLVSEGMTGAVFPFGDAGALAQCMLRLAADPEHARAMGQAARERVLRDYSVERSAQGTLRAIHSVAGPT
jgi:glycosyltransferase involved in cell wall biosynthesis